jgi:hypothetical protein
MNMVLVEKYIVTRKVKGNVSRGPWDFAGNMDRA